MITRLPEPYIFISLFQRQTSLNCPSVMQIILTVMQIYFPLLKLSKIL